MRLTRRAALIAGALTALPASAAPAAKGVADAMIGDSLAGFGGKLAGFDDEPLLARIAVPTLLLYGQYDVLTSVAERAVAAKLRQGRAEEIAGAGHMAQFDAPDAWRRSVAGFISAYD